MNRRTLVLTAGLIAIGAGFANGAGAQMADIKGVLTFESGGEIPKGQISVTLSNPVTATGAEKTLLESDGTATSIPFSVSLADTARDAGKLKIIVRLEREDGWLLARGSALIEAGEQVEIQLNTAVY
jgi:hypothetical protein